MKTKTSIRISTFLTAAAMALSMQTSLCAAAAPEAGQIPPLNSSNTQTPVGEITQNNIIYSIFDGNEAHVKDGSAASGTVQIPDAVYANGTYYIVKKIESRAFEGNDNITALDMQYASGLTDIEMQAFANCKNLETVALPFNVTINQFFAVAFSGCTSLREFVPTYGKNYFIESGIVYNKNKTQIIKYPPAKPDTSYTVNDGLTVGFNAFNGVRYLQNINVPTELNESTAGTILKKYNAILRQIENGNISINGVSIFTYSEDDSEEPQVNPVFRDVICSNLEFITSPSNQYAKHYANYVVKQIINDNDTDFIKALKLHNWLCERVNYDPVVSAAIARGETYIGEKKNHCDASAFLHYENASDSYSEAGYYTVCDGYSRAYKLLLNAAGVCCERVEAEPADGGKNGHAWSVVKLNAYDNDPDNDRCYYVDVTWDDNKNGWDYTYFMRSDNPDDFNHSSKYTNWHIVGNDENSKLSAIPEKTYSIKNLGDLNGDKNVTGADLVILRDYDNSSNWSDDQRANADLNFDGVIDDNDVQFLAEFVDARLGDINGSGTVDQDDYNSLANYLTGIGMVDYMKVAADVNMDGNIDNNDLEALKSLFGRSYGKVKYRFNEYCFDKIQQQIAE